jgi:hypothetical protein
MDPEPSINKQKNKKTSISAILWLLFALNHKHQACFMKTTKTKEKINETSLFKLGSTKRSPGVNFITPSNGHKRSLMCLNSEASEYQYQENLLPIPVFKCGVYQVPTLVQ